MTFNQDILNTAIETARRKGVWPRTLLALSSRLTGMQASLRSPGCSRNAPRLF
jgi:hypothetical protein